MNTIKFIAPEVAIFDIEYVPCITTGRRILKLAPDVPDDVVLNEMNLYMGATDAEPNPMLKSVMYRVISIAAIIRKESIGPASEDSPRVIKLSLGSRPTFATPAPDDQVTEEDIFDEKKLISGFLNYLGQYRPQVVGFASSIYDLPVLWQRAVIHGLSVPDFCRRPAKPWEPEPDYFGKYNDYNIDLLHIVGTFGKGSPKLSEIALASGIPAKIGMDGSEVAANWFAGNRREIVAYNECDALTTYLLWLRCAHTCGLVSDAEVEEEEISLGDMLRARTAEEGANQHLATFLSNWEALQVGAGSPKPEAAVAVGEQAF